MARKINNFFTVYHVMDQKGIFDDNPANTSSLEFSGPQEFPKMLYHPKGEFRITVPAEILTTPLGPKLVGEQKELIWRVVNSAEEEKALLAEGWHRKPEDSLAKREVEPVVQADPKAELEALRAELAAAKAKLAEAPAPAPKSFAKGA